MSKLIENNQTIFLAGANGMVGNSIKKALLRIGFSNDEKNGNLYTPSKKELNLLDRASVDNWFKKKKPSIVILAAAKVGGIHANSTYPADFLIENLKIQTNVIELAWKNGVNRLLFLGSSCIYPKYSQQPIKEEYLLTNSLECTNESYAIAKIAGLKLCEALRVQYNFDSISLMPSNLYGPNDNYHPMNSHVIASLIRKFLIAKKENLTTVTCWGSGSVLREFLHVDDLADAAIFCLENWYPNSKNAPKNSLGESLNHLNVGTGKDIKIIELAKKIADFTNFKGEILWDKSKPDGTPKKVLNVDNINQLGWRASIDLDTGLKSTIKNLNISELCFF